MRVSLEKSSCTNGVLIEISGSKSESNRMLLLQALFPAIQIENISHSDDSRVMQSALASCDDVIDIHHAGTAMRFLTAYFAIQPGRVVTLTGTDRMKQRPVRILVEALRQLGAQIAYIGADGFPPLKITGKKLDGGTLVVDAGISSQYITSLLLVGASLENGITIEMEGEITSAPYIEMTLALLRKVGIKSQFTNNRITVFHKPHFDLENIKVRIESDWSSASYFYSLIALSETGTSVTLRTFNDQSIQGDSALTEIYKDLGVETKFENNQILLTKAYLQAPASNKELSLNLIKTPDIAQTLAVTCFGLGLGCQLTGLHTLKIKETDRLTALKNELEKLGASVEITADSLTLQPAKSINPDVEIETYSDHRMAMAFAPLALKVPIVIKDAEVVTKSYPNFWTDLKSVGINTK